jgi:tRNA-modifying protein YgfZ
MTPLEQLDRLRDDAAVVERPGRGHVLVTGPDAFSFLQALVSADLDPLADGDGVHCLLLTPQGKLDVDFRLLRVGDEAWLDCEPGFGAHLAGSLDKFRIRVKADVVDRSDEWSTLSLVGPAVPDGPHGLPVPSRLHDHLASGDVRVVRTELGLDMVGPRAAVDGEARRLRDAEYASAGVDAYEAFRIERGIPVQPNELDETTIPQEAFLERDAVSFTKGCFLGQELVCRIDSRGHVNRFLRSFSAIEGDWPVAGAEVVVAGKVVGTLTSVAPAELPTGALGYVRHEVDPPAAVELRWPGGTARARI